MQWKTQELLTREKKGDDEECFPVAGGFYPSAKAPAFTDADGKKYIDFLSGIAVLALGGHSSSSRLVSVMQRQAAKILHVSNYFFLKEQVELAEKLPRLSRLGPGLSSVTAGRRTTRPPSSWRGNTPGNRGQYEIITALDSFHGRTMGARLAATRQPKYQEPLPPLPEGFRYATLNDLAAWKAAINDRTCAVLIEPVQGEGGVRLGKEKNLSRA